jgi:hypothetical protein
MKTSLPIPRSAVDEIPESAAEKEVKLSPSSRRRASVEVTQSADQMIRRHPTPVLAFLEDGHARRPQYVPSLNSKIKIKQGNATVTQLNGRVPEKVAVSLVENDQDTEFEFIVLSLSELKCKSSETCTEFLTDIR